MATKLDFRSKIFRIAHRIHQEKELSFPAALENAWSRYRNWIFDEILFSFNYRVLSLGEKNQIIRIIQRSESGANITRADIQFIRDMATRSTKTHLTA